MALDKTMVVRKADAINPEPSAGRGRYTVTLPFVVRYRVPVKLIILMIMTLIVWVAGGWYTGVVYGK